MNSPGHEFAGRVLPLLRSIALELEERQAALTALVARERGRRSPRQRSLIGAERAAHRRGIEAARRELARLGCAQIGQHPPTFRVPLFEGKTRPTAVWRLSRSRFSPEASPRPTA
jgi:hypothetical protein